MKTLSTVHSIEVPPDCHVLAELEELTSQSSGSLNQVTTTAYRDVAIILEILKLSNTFDYTGGKQSIVDVQSAVTRIGWSAVKELLFSIGNRNPTRTTKHQKWLEIHRSRCRRTGMVARLLADSLAKNLTQEAQTIASFVYFGEILAALHLGSLYQEIADSSHRSRTLYRLSTDYSFDVEEVRSAYLEKQGIPLVVLEVLSREGSKNKVGKTPLKPIVLSAAELVDSFDNKKIARYHNQSEIPSISALRNLKISQYHYPKLIERVEMYLESAQKIELGRKNSAHALGVDSQPAGNRNNPSPLANSSENLEQPEDEPPAEEIILSTSNTETAPRTESKEAEPTKQLSPLNSSSPLSLSPLAPPPHHEPGESTSTESQERLPSPGRFSPNPVEIFDLENSAKSRHYRRAARVVYSSLDEDEIVEHPPTTVGAPSKKANLVNKVFKIAETSEQLLALTLEILVQAGFENALIMVVNKKAAKGMVLAARGRSYRSGNIFEVSSTMGPFYEAFSQVKSSRSNGDTESPFGPSTFAIAPIQLDHSLPVLIYCDCGEEGVINFESRRIFRHIVRTLNYRLPRLPGGILTEFN